MQPVPKPHPPLVSPLLRQSAKGQRCTVRWASGCADDETVVLAHVRAGHFGGGGQKPPDFMACFACFACHNAIDGRGTSRPPADYVLRAVFETWSVWFAKGLLAVRSTKGAEIERLVDGLKQIDAWARAYPERIFPGPDFAKVSEALRAADISSDALHGTWARHLMEGVGRIARAALADQDEGKP